MTDIAEPGVTTRDRRGINPIIYLFAAPAALTLLSGLGEVVDFSALFHRLLRVWRAATHWAWDGLFGWIGPILQFHPTPMQKDGLTLSVMFLGAGLAPLVMRTAAHPAPEFHIRRGAEQWLFFGALVAILGIFLFPYLGEIARAATVSTPGWAKPIVYVLLGILLIGIVTALALTSPPRSTQRAHGETLFSSKFSTAFYVGFGIAAGSFFISSSDFSSYMPEARSPGLLGLIRDWLSASVRQLTSRETWAGFAVQWTLAAIFAAGFALMYERNPRAVIRIVAIGVGLFVADRLVAIAQPNLPALIAQLEAWERGLSTAP